ncbi:MAG: hypothetical protein DLM66_03685 [Candidatus Dormiibacter spiritus]|nr:MAG: hypothetical protein DLM66_03685 [Candidatus Dormibacteraeota bacterium]
MSGKPSAEAKVALRDLVRATARRRAVITYPEAAEAHPELPKTGTHMGKVIGNLLADINKDEGILLSCVVVQNGTLLPGPGFYTLKGAPRTLDRYYALLRKVWKRYGSN